MAAIAIDDFLVAAENQTAMDEFYNTMQKRYDIKRLGWPNRYLGWLCHYDGNGGVSLCQILLTDKTLKEACLIHCNGKNTPYPPDTQYHAQDDEEEILLDTVALYRKLVGDLRYIADSTRPDVSYVTGRLGAAMVKPTIRH